MTKMREVAALLDVEIEEEFGVTGKNGNLYKITDSGILKKSQSDTWLETFGYTLYEVLTGKQKIIKIPWRPKKGEEYWSVTYYGASSCEWQGGISDLAYYAIGNCFETKEEAEASSKEVMARLEKIYTDGKPLIGEDERKAKE